MRAVMENDQSKIDDYSADAEVLEMMARFQKLANEAGLDPSMFENQ